MPFLESPCRRHSTLSRRAILPKASKVKLNHICNGFVFNVGQIQTRDTIEKSPRLSKRTMDVAFERYDLNRLSADGAEPDRCFPISQDYPPVRAGYQNPVAVEPLAVLAPNVLAYPPPSNSKKPKTKPSQATRTQAYSPRYQQSTHTPTIEMKMSRFAKQATKHSVLHPSADPPPS